MIDSVFDYSTYIIVKSFAIRSCLQKAGHFGLSCACTNILHRFAGRVVPVQPRPPTNMSAGCSAAVQQAPLESVCFLNAL